MFGFFWSDQPEITAEHKQCAKDYALLMLGAPVVKVELDQSQLDLCVEASVDCINESGRATERNLQRILQEGTLAHAKMVLGRIRGKYQNPPGPGGELVLDGNKLLSEGTSDLSMWKWNLGLR